MLTIISKLILFEKIFEKVSFFRKNLKFFRKNNFSRDFYIFSQKCQFEYNSKH